MIKLVGIGGSLRRNSYNLGLLRAAAELMPQGAALEVHSIVGVPLYDADGEEADGIPPSVTALKEALAGADGLVLATPEYNNGIPGVLKNAIDWASRPYGDSAWNGKPVAIMGASVGVIGTARAQYHLRQVFVFLDMDAVNQPEVMINASKSFDDQGNLTDQQTRELIGKLLANLVKKAGERKA